MKNKLTKKLLSILLSLVLMLGLVPGTAFAEGHTHSFTYSADGATITATCQNAGCDLNDNKVTLTIVPNPVLYYDDGQPKEASLEGLEAFNAATEKNISTDNIAYYKGDTNVTAQIKAGSGTSIKGATYTARLDVEGKRATVTFILTAKPIPHTHVFTYNAEGNVITATCTQNASNIEACDLTNKQATLTLNAPLHTTYGDGKDANATLTGEIPGVTNPTIHYSKGSVTLSSAPTDAGTYTAWCQLGDATARVEYTINKATNLGWTTMPQAKQNLKYTGQPQALITAGAASAGNVLYTVGTDPDNEPDDTAGGRPYTYSVPEMTNAGTYYVWCKIDGGKNYTSINAQKVEVTINKATPTYSAPTGLTAGYGETLADVLLPDGWSWDDSTEIVGDLGENVHKATFTPEDTANYLVVSGVDVTVTVGKGTIRNYTKPTAAHIKYPQTLSEATLTGGDTGDIEGVWSWLIPDAQPISSQSGSSFELIFTPTGIYAELYNPIVTRLAVIVEPAEFEPDSISDADEDITLYGEFADGVGLELTPITHNQSAYLALLRASSRDASGLRKLVLFKTMTLTGAEEAYNGTLTLTSFVGEKRAGETVSAWFFIDGAPVNYVGTVDADGFLVIEGLTL